MSEHAPLPSIALRFQAAHCHHQSGRLEEAGEGYREVLAQDPNHADAWHLLGLLSHQLGEQAVAVAMIRRALRIRGADPHYLGNLGLVYVSAKQLEDAVACFREALAICPGDVQTLRNLGVALRELGHLEAALEPFRQAAELLPEDPELRRILEGLHLELGLKQQAQGDLVKAIASLAEAVKVGESREARGAFFRLLRQLPQFPDGVDLRTPLIRALREPWCRPEDILAPCISLLQSSPELAKVLQRAVDVWPTRLSSEALFGPGGVPEDPLLLQLLESTAVTRRDMERFLTLARAALLEEALGDNPGEGHLVFACALARQCFINEYAFSRSAAEDGAVVQLRERVLARLLSGEPVPPLGLAILGAYFPLMELGPVSPGDPWPAPVQALLAQQVLEPMQERELRRTFPALTPIQGEVSRMVRQQYEENPYPRWVKAAPPTPEASLDAYLRREFPSAPFRPIERTGPVRVLIAGCGSGRQPIEAARICPDVQVLAIDLSLSSLACAKRKAQELGLENIEFAQADILELGSLGREFDLIEAFGVLHHLQDPIAGWRVLLSLLQPRGIMGLGLYSELGRRDVVAAREFIAQRGYSTSAEDIRRCRQELMSDEHFGRFKQFSTSIDFYGISSCRDLLFHVQEHRFTIPRLKQLFDELELRFSGFMVSPEVNAEYRARYPDDEARTHLDNWNQLEERFPPLFRAMYQFLVQRR